MELHAKKIAESQATLAFKHIDMGKHDAFAQKHGFIALLEKDLLPRIPGYNDDKLAKLTSEVAKLKGSYRRDLYTEEIKERRET